MDKIIWTTYFLAVRYIPNCVHSRYMRNAGECEFYLDIGVSSDEFCYHLVVTTTMQNCVLLLCKIVYIGQSMYKTKHSSIGTYSNLLPNRIGKEAASSTCILCGVAIVTSFGGTRKIEYIKEGSETERL